MSKDKQIQFQALSKVAVELVKAGKTDKEDLQKVVSITKYLMAAVPKMEGSSSFSASAETRMERVESYDNPLDAVIPMGKHKGKLLKDLPVNSQKWYIEKMDINEKFADTAFNKAILSLRNSEKNADLEAVKLEL